MLHGHKSPDRRTPAPWLRKEKGSAAWLSQTPRVPPHDRIAGRHGPNLIESNVSMMSANASRRAQTTPPTSRSSSIRLIPCHAVAQKTLPVQEQGELLEKQRPGGLLLEHQVVRAWQRDVSCTRDVGREHAASLRHDRVIVIAVDDECRCLHQRKQWSNVDVVVALHEPRGVFR